MNILLIEDSPGDTVLLKRMLRDSTHFDFNLVQASFLRDAISLLKNQDFDLILLDLFLPDCYGLDGFTALIKLKPSVPIVVLSGVADEDLATCAVRLGAQDYLIKGQVDKNLLVRSLRHAVERKQAEGKLLTYQKQLRSLVSTLANTEEEERRRIGDDLHEHIGQILAMAKIKLGVLQETSDNAFLGKAMGEIRDLISQAIEYTRSLTYELTSPVLYELGFESAVEAFLDKFHTRYALNVDYRNDGQEKPLEDGVRLVLFQAVRELLINIAKHAHADNVIVSLERVDSWIRLYISDDGVGFNVHEIQSRDEKTRGIGLFNIRDRVDFFGGDFSIQSEPGKGTKVTLNAPLKLQ